MSPNPEGQGAIHDEVYLALRPLTNIMRIFGLFPIPKNSFQDEKIQSVVEEIKFSWKSKLMMFSLSALAGVICFGIGDSKDYSLNAPDPLERVILTFIVMVLFLAAFVNLCTMVAKGPKWQSYFKQWQLVDSSMDITLDMTFRSFVRTSSRGYLVYLAASLSTTLYAALMKYTVSSEDDYTNDGFIVGLVCFSFFINGCQLLPELLFICLTVAMKVRISLLKEKLEENLRRRAMPSVSADVKTDMAEDLQNLRISYHYIVEVMKTTNAFMGPVLCMCVMLTTAYLSATIFMLFFQSLDNQGFVILKLVASTCCVIRLTSICLFAEQVKTKVDELKRMIYAIPIGQLQVSEQSVDEFAILVTIVKKAMFSFTANDFFSIDKELLNKMSGAILTYTLTILELYERQERDTVRCPPIALQ